MRAAQVLICLCMVVNCQAQALKTLFKWDSLGMGSFKWYGEMFAKGTLIKEEPTIIIGGRGGFILNRKIAFGGIGAGYLLPTPILGNNLKGNSNTELNIKMGSGGVFFEYIHKMESAIHVSVPLSLTIGDLEITDNQLGDRIESSRVLMIEPGINIEFNISKFLIICISGGYRIAKINPLINLQSQDISGPVVGLVGKFASF